MSASDFEPERVIEVDVGVLAPVLFA